MVQGNRSQSAVTPPRSASSRGSRAAHESEGIIFAKKARSLRSNERAKNKTAAKRKKTTSEYPMTSERAAKAAPNCRATLRLTPRFFGSLWEGFRNRFFSRSIDARRAISLRAAAGPPRRVRAPTRGSMTKSSSIRRRRLRAQRPAPRRERRRTPIALSVFGANSAPCRKGLRRQSIAGSGRDA